MSTLAELKAELAARKETAQSPEAITPAAAVPTPTATPIATPAPSGVDVSRFQTTTPPPPPQGEGEEPDVFSKFGSSGAKASKAEKGAQTADLHQKGALMGLEPEDMTTGNAQFKAALQDRIPPKPTVWGGIKKHAKAALGGIKEGAQSVHDSTIFAGKAIGDFVGGASYDFRATKDVNDRFDKQKEILTKAGGPSIEMDLLVLEQDRQKALEGAMMEVSDDDAKAIAADLGRAVVQVGTAIAGPMLKAPAAVEALGPVAKFLAARGLSAAEAGTAGFTEESLRVIANGGTKAEALKAGMTGALWGAVFGAVLGGAPGKKGKSIRSAKKAQGIASESATSLKSLRKGVAEGAGIEIDTPGKWKEFFFGKKAPSRPASDAVKRGISDLAEGAQEVPTNPVKLHDAAKARGIKVGKELRPEMADVGLDTKIRPGGIGSNKGKLKEVADSIRKDILEQPSLLMKEADKKKLGKILDKIDNATTLDEVWDARIEWDGLQTNGIKQATSLSDSITQHRNDIWTTTRDIMNNIMDEVAEQAGKPGVAKKFQQMRDLFEIQENIIARIGEYAKQTKGILKSKAAAATVVGVSAASYVGKKIKDVVKP